MSTAQKPAIMTRPVYISDPVGEKHRSKADHAFIVENMHKTIMDQLAKHGLVGEKHEVVHGIKPEAASLDGYSGLILLGGFDIDPMFYTEGHGYQRYAIGNTDIDAHQLDLIYEAYKRDLPVLGICRGQQLINVFFDGTLHYDIGHLAQVRHDNWGGATYGQRASVHGVHISGSKAIPQGTYNVASSHHQAVDKLGVGLVITGYSTDGIVEMIEHEEKNIIGVQWHPESSHVNQSDTITPLITHFATGIDLTDRGPVLERPVLAHTATKSHYFTDVVPEFEDEFDLDEFDPEIPYTDGEEIPMWQVDTRTGELLPVPATDDPWVDVADYRDYDNWRHGTYPSGLGKVAQIKRRATTLKPMF